MRRSRRGSGTASRSAAAAGLPGPAPTQAPVLMVSEDDRVYLGPDTTCWDPRFPEALTREGLGLVRMVPDQLQALDRFLLVDPR
jgi:hypothetical protein